MSGAQPVWGAQPCVGTGMGAVGTRWGRCGRGGDAVAAVAVPDSDVQPKLTGAHGPERPKAAYGRIIALNSADSVLSSESPGLRGPGRAGGALQTPHPSKGGWAGGAPPQRRSRGSRVAGPVSHVWGLLVPRSRLCTRDTIRMSPLSPFVSPAWRVAQLRLSPWDGDMAPMAVPFRMGLESRSWDGEG